MFVVQHDLQPWLVLRLAPRLIYHRFACGIHLTPYACWRRHRGSSATGTISIGVTNRRHLFDLPHGRRATGLSPWGRFFTGCAITCGRQSAAAVDFMLLNRIPFSTPRNWVAGKMDGQSAISPSLAPSAPSGFLVGFSKCCWCICRS